MNVSEMMCRPVTTCTEEVSLSSAARMMTDNDCGMLPVLRRGVVVGILTDRDICVAFGRKTGSSAEMLVKDVMSKPVASCTTTDDVGNALATMAARRVRRLPVLDPKGALAGVLSLDDVALRAEEPMPGGIPPAITCGDLVRTFRTIAGARPLRRPA